MSELTEMEKLRVLLPHWIEHNVEHMAGFRQWAAKAKESGQEAAAEQIEVAVERTEACNETLAAALEELEG